MDDYSRFTWVYLLKSKYDVSNIFPTFCTRIHTQFGTNIKSVRSNNAPNLLFRISFVKRGFCHSTHVLTLLNKIFVVEHKHQHLLNVARALLFQPNIPLSFWGDCILTATYS